MASANDVAIASAAGLTLLSMKDMRNRDTFTGRTEDWDSWWFPFETDAEHLGWRDLIIASKESTVPIKTVDLGNIAEVVSRNLYLWLSQRTQGKAQVIVRLVEDKCGFEALRLLAYEYAPKGDTSSHGMLAAVIQPVWWRKSPHSTRSFMDVLLDWESLIVKYENSSKETIGDGIKCATITGYAPKAIQALLQSAPHETRHTYRLMWSTIREFLVETGEGAFVPKGDTDAMDVGAVERNGEVDAIGFDKPVCGICGKIGHKSPQCWCKDGHKGDKCKGKRTRHKLAERR